jgi:hypothetical protein
MAQGESYVVFMSDKRGFGNGEPLLQKLKDLLS